MLEVSYRKVIPYPLEVVLGQYWDWEHIAVVHPDTLGEYRLVSAEGDSAVYEQIWPRRLLRRRRSRVRQTQVSANEIEFVFLAGLHRGVRVRTVLEEHPDGTLVDETYTMNLPDWRWLKPLLAKVVMKSVERIWGEDLGVEVCHGGWPGRPPFEMKVEEGA